jgi:hypothetical protein
MKIHIMLVFHFLVYHFCLVFHLKDKFCNFHLYLIFHYLCIYLIHKANHLHCLLLYLIFSDTQDIRHTDHSHQSFEVHYYKYLVHKPFHLALIFLWMDYNHYIDLIKLLFIFLHIGRVHTIFHHLYLEYFVTSHSHHNFHIYRWLKAFIYRYKYQNHILHHYSILVLQAIFFSNYHMAYKFHHHSAAIFLYINQVHTLNRHFMLFNIQDIWCI